MNNPFWRRSMIRQAYRLAASRVTVIAVITAVVCALAVVGISAI